MFSFWSILRIIYSIAFTLLFLYCTQFITSIEEKKKCSLSEGWRITNGKIIGSILMIIGIINICLPASKFLASLPIIGSSYVLIFALAIFGELFIVNRLAVKIDESTSSKCKLKGYNTLIDIFSSIGVTECIYITIIISVIFLYL